MLNHCWADGDCPVGLGHSANPLLANERWQSRPWYVGVPSTPTILRHIESLGYAVSVFNLSSTRVRDDGTGNPQIIRGGDYVEIHAIRLSNPDVQHIARCMDG